MKCKDISELIASGGADELNFWQRLELKTHLLLCRHCQSYAHQIASLGKGARGLLRTNEPTAAELQRLEDAICQRLCDDRHT